MRVPQPMTRVYINENQSFNINHSKEQDVPRNIEKKLKTYQPLQTLVDETPKKSSNLKAL
jgi:hypothetical protein